MPLLLLGGAEETTDETTVGAYAVSADPTTGNALPDGGLLAPLVRSLLPQAFNPPGDTPTLDAIGDAYDQGWEQARGLVTGALPAAHRWASAVGPDLDNQGALVGVPRLAGEGDEAYRPRIPATVNNRNVATRPGMVAWLQQVAPGIPVTVTPYDVPPGATITFVGIPPQGEALVPLIRARKPFGLPITIAVRTGDVFGRLGTWRLGSGTLNGGHSYITLYQSPTPTPGIGRLGEWRLGTVRL